METSGNVNADCELLNLPPELRNNIYELALVHADQVKIPASGRLSAPALSQVCREIRHEATAIYYGQNTFHCTVISSPTTNVAYLWLAHLPKTTVPLINKLMISCGVSARLRELVREMVMELPQHLAQAALNAFEGPVAAEYIQEITGFYDAWAHLVVTVGLKPSALHFSTVERKYTGGGWSGDEACQMTLETYRVAWKRESERMMKLMESLGEDVFW